MAYWKISGLRDPMSIREFGGVYAPEDEGFNLPDGVATDMSNISGLSYPAISTRPGYSLLGGALGGRVAGLGAWKDTEVHSIANGVWRRWNGSAWVDLLSGLSVSAAASFTNFQGNLAGINLIMANGVDAPRRYDGSTAQVLAGAPATGNFVEQHDNRCYMAVGNIVKYSGLRKPEDWVTAKEAGEIVIESSDGEVITALKSGPKHLIVFKPNSMYDLLGSGPSDYTLIPVANDIGAINNNCVVNIGGLVYFLHTTGVYSYASARPKKDFCKPVMPFIRRINQVAKDKCSVGTDGRSLFMSIPLGAATEPDTILQYDLEHGVWYIWKGYSSLDFLNIDSDLFIGNVDGTVRKVGGTTDNGVAITGKWISKPFTAGSAARKMNWYNLWNVVTLPTGSSLSIYLSKSPSGDSDWTLIKSFTASNAIQSTRLHIPANTVALANFVRVKLEWSGPVEISEFIRQYREMPWR